MTFNGCMGSRAPKNKKTKLCRWCNKLLPSARGGRAIFCDITCNRSYNQYRYTVLTPPIDWKKCALKGCDNWFPIWGHLSALHKKKRCCCSGHSSKHNRKKRGKAIKNSHVARLKVSKVVMDRSIECFRTITFGRLQCEKYFDCAQTMYKKCTGYVNKEHSEYYSL